MDEILRKFETMVNMCEVDDGEKLREMPLMVKGDVLSYFLTYQTKESRFEDVKAMMRRWYNFGYKKESI